VGEGAHQVSAEIDSGGLTHTLKFDVALHRGYFPLTKNEALDTRSASN
jgi:hypothetical protein